jgi:PLP dependent protein
MFSVQAWNETNDKIGEAATKSGRSFNEVTLIAVSKTKPIEEVQAALSAGQLIFGENRVQEALQKFPQLRSENTNLQLHLIGPLQTNKVKEVVRDFDVIQTIDRAKLVDAVTKEMVKQDRQLSCFIQVNTGGEAQKAGVELDELTGLYEYCAEKNLIVEGLMCIPPVEDHPGPHFALLHKWAERLNLKSLSMGMSSDFEIAVELGATHVRVGSALFGGRPPLV